MLQYIVVWLHWLPCHVPFDQYVSGLLLSGRVGVVVDVLTEPVCRGRVS